MGRMLLSVDCLSFTNVRYYEHWIGYLSNHTTLLFVAYLFACLLDRSRLTFLLEVHFSISFACVFEVSLACVWFAALVVPWGSFC
jgi:hypothetical protein